MNTIETSKIRSDFRIKCALRYLIIALILILFSLIINNSCGFRLDDAGFFDTFLWSLAFTFLGFCLLILKICINDIKILGDKEGDTPEEKKKILEEKEKEQLEQKKRRLRYRYFYPIFLLVFAVLSIAVSISNFIYLDEFQYFIGSALLSFLLGFFIDSIPNVIDKVGKAFTS